MLLVVNYCPYCGSRNYGSDLCVYCGRSWVRL